jgi:hypothetical protein
MPKNARIPKSDLSDPRLHDAARLMAELVDERTGPEADFAARSKARQAIAKEVLQMLARRRSTHNDDAED